MFSKKHFAIALTLTLSLTFAEQKKVSPTIYNVPPNVIEQVYNSTVQTDRVILLFGNTGVATFPSYRALKVFNTIEVNPVIPEVVLFQNRKIIKAEASFSGKLEADRNLLRFSVPGDFRYGVIDLWLEKPDNSTEFVRLFLKVFNPYDNLKKNKILYPTVVYLDRPVLSPEEVLKRYLFYFKHLPRKDTSFYVDGIVYYIYVNPRFPNIYIDNTAFRVEVVRIKY